MFAVFTALRWAAYNKARKVSQFDDPTPSLPLASEYHWGFSIVVSGVALLAHVLFMVGQSQIVWNTAALGKFNNIHVNGTVPVLQTNIDFRITKFAPPTAFLQNHSYFDLVNLQILVRSRPHVSKP